MKKIIIVGATSGIGEGLVCRYAENGCVKIGIIGRRRDLLDNLCASYPDVCESAVCDVTDVARAEVVLNGLVERLGGLDLLILSAGTGDLNPSLDYRIESEALQLNVVSWTFIVDWSIRFFEKQGSGHLAAITSVGGLRGNGIAPAYNATKAFQINYLEGMRQRVVSSRMPIVVTDIRPGFVDTAMAKGEGLFWKAPVDKVARQIVKGLEHKRSIVYVTRRWRIVAGLWKCIPDGLFVRMGAGSSEH